MNELLQPTKIIRTQRKSLSLIINNRGELIVRAPLFYKDSVIFDFINKKSNWIIAKRTQMINEKTYPLEIKSGEKFTILGREYEIYITTVKSVKIKDNQILIPINNSKQKLILFLKRSLKNIVTSKITYWLNWYNFNVSNISISSAKTNWGSCSSSNRLHFTYKLMLCPEAIIDYIIVHELVHTVIKNHSTNFWRNVKKLYPSYKNCERWLKENRSIVELI